ncbi:anaerobic magnesium-protoporphyrin IX monomethyl ester cyclase protein [Marine Group I thaumarchaeote SCGC AAA799-B03]|uniref:Anaerobic magnesium-protoporphyrin IX monomethyl ester cyclase protein n=1 Tax=Marine Group I thaumarchaeote SCGC AAA799-B03 TaxID=1502289 RepID=A0A087S910_9ARCH|nr:anaerobic magnesium-protoporphyrin IX monomethyl ester cyclase protein [Marine Group I thaumarchaeote SCGC AAA799-B03]
MRILLTNVPAYINDDTRHYIGAGSQRWSHSLNIPKGDKAASEFKYLEYPFNLGYSSALLKRDTDEEIRAWDPCALDLDEKDFCDYVSSYSPDVLVVEVPTVSFPPMMEILRTLKKDVGCKLIVAGQHITGLTKDVMEKYDFIDFALLGEYELTIKELVEHLSKNKHDLGEIKGIAYRKGNEVFENTRRPLINPIDQLPFPDREDIDPTLHEDAVFAGTPCIQMLSSRGCPVGCTFCVPIQVSFSSLLYRTRDPKKIVEEMLLVQEKYGAKQIYFDDDTMVINKKHIEDLCNEMIKQDLQLPWSCMGDITVKDETLKLMEKAGCCGIKFGVDSVTPETLEAIHKGTVTTDKVTKFVKKCKDLNLKTHASFVIGLPSDTKKGIVDMMDYATRLNLDAGQFSIATPFPGTPFFEEAKHKGWLRTEDWNQYDGARTAVLNYPNLSSQEIEEFHQIAVKKWYNYAFRKNLKSPKATLLQIQRRGVKGSLKGLKMALSGYSINEKSA